jgi:WD40 repeat protein
MTWLWGERKVSQRSQWTQRSLAFLRQNQRGLAVSSHEALRQRLYTRDYRDRLLVLTEIFPLGAAGLPLLFEACRDPQGAVRELALNCLSAFGDRADVSQLLETVARWRGIGCVNTLRAHDAAITELAICPEQQVIATTAADGGDVRFWNLVDGKCLNGGETIRMQPIQNWPINAWKTQGNTTEKNISAIAIDPAQSQLAIATKNGTLKVLCQKVRRKRWSNQLDDCCEIMSLAFDLENRILWSGDRRSRLSSWNAETGALIDTWGSWHDRGIPQLVIVPESPVLLHPCGMGVKIWHREMGFLIHELVGHRAVVGAIAVTQDGQRVVTGSDDGVIKIWQLGSDFGRRRDLVS